MKVKIRWVNGNESTYTEVTTLRGVTGVPAPAATPGELWLLMSQVASLQTFVEPEPKPSTFDS